MKRVITLAAVLFTGRLASASVCSSAPLTTYLNSGSFFSCTEGALTAEFNKGLLPSYVGLNLLSSNNGAEPTDIGVVPGSPGFNFNSLSFSENSAVLSSQAELVHFYLDGGASPIVQTTLSLNAVATSIGGLGLGSGLAIGQELLCVGGQFTSLPTGLVTSVANGVLGAGAFGCNGTALIGTAAASSGPLNAITSLLDLPNITGLTDQAKIQLSPMNPTQLDVIKLQALISVGGGSASDTGFGNTYTLGAVPEPGTGWLLLTAVIGAVCKSLGRRKLPRPLAD